MYVTRPLSLYYNSPGAAAERPPKGPNSGIIVLEDEEAEKQTRCCWGLCRTSSLFDVPFPQNRMITVVYSMGHHTVCDNVFFVPVIGEPLSSNRYYVLRADGRNRGKACTSSKEEDTTTFCLCSRVNDAEPTSFNPRDVYQQFQIACGKNKSCAASVAPDGIPPNFLRRKGWRAYASKPPSRYTLGEAQGIINPSLRTRMPDLRSPSTVIGKWYCPYIFIKEGEQRAKDQMRRSMFYEMTLEQFWEEIYTDENYNGKEKVVKFNVSVLRETALLNGRVPVNENREVDAEEMMWFTPVVSSTGSGLGLSLAIWERMRWEEVRGGWACVDKVERVERVEEVREGKSWKKFGCYVLVERFVLKRMDGSVALTYDFKHTNKVQVLWE